MTFQEILKELRAKKKLTQKELASLVGISPVQLNRYENGIIRPRLPILAKLAEILDVEFNILSNSLNVNSIPGNESAPQKNNSLRKTRLKKIQHDFEELPYEDKIIFAFQINNSLLLEAIKS